MTTTKTALAQKKTQTRANRIAKGYATQLADLEQQKADMQAEIRAKKRELRAAEKAALLDAQSEFGAWFTSFARAHSAADIEKLRERLHSHGIMDLVKSRLAQEPEPARIVSAPDMGNHSESRMHQP